MKVTFGLLLILLLDANCHAQAQPVLKAVDLEADAAILRSAYEQLHPGLYRYNSKAEMDSLQDAFLAFSEFAAKVRCGHTQANPFNQSKSLVEALFKSATRLPFYFDWLGGHMIVGHDFTPTHVLPAETEITQINGVTSSAILARLLTIARADGSNDYPMFSPLNGATDILLVRKPKSAKTEQIAVSPLTFEQRIAPIKQRGEQPKGGDGPLFEWKYLANGSHAQCTRADPRYSRQ